MTAHPTLRLLHDLGAATWFGGSLMGATALNPATSQLDDPVQRASASTAGWSRWAPVGTAAVVAHAVGAAGLARTEAPRVALQQGAGRTTAVKTALTAAGLGVTAWSAVLNRRMAALGPAPVRGATEPAAVTPTPVADTQRQLQAVQWLNPLLSGAIVGVAAWQSEQQRTTQVLPGLLKGVGARVPAAVPAVAAFTLVSLLARRRRTRSQLGADSRTAAAPRSIDLTDSATVGPDGVPVGDPLWVSRDAAREAAHPRP